MKTLVVLPMGAHPFHAGHMALYNSAKAAFPESDVYIAATNDTSTRPFPFAVKQKLAKLSGVPENRFIPVKSPFRADEITQNYDPADTQLIFVRSEKDATKPPQAGGIKRDGTPSYLQPISDQMAPMTQHAYMAYLPTVEFGPGMTSATQIRTAWPNLTERQRTALVMSLYPNTQKNPKLANTVVKMLDTAMGGEAQGVAESVNEGFDQPYPITWEKGDHGDVDALARLPDGTNLSIMFNKQDNIKPDDKTWMVEFYRNNSQEVTGEGDAQRVFATVLSAIQQFIVKYKPLKIYFSASKLLDPSINYGPDDVVPNPESRAKLYDRLVQRYANAWGYRALRGDTHASVMYELSRIPKQKTVGEEVTRQMNIGGMRASYQSKYNQPIAEDYLDEARL